MACSNLVSTFWSQRGVGDECEGDGALSPESRVAGQFGVEGITVPHKFDHRPLLSEYHLLLGDVPGDRRGRVVETGGELPLKKLCGFLGTLAPEAQRATQRDLGRRTGTSGSGGAEVPGLNLRLVNLPAYSSHINADKAIWGWVREEATGNLCLGNKSKVQKRVGHFFARLNSRKDEVKRRCRTVPQSRAESLLQHPPPDSRLTRNEHPTLDLIQATQLQL